MIVEKLSADFISDWKDHLAINSSLELDGTWPSVGVLDLLTFALRRKEQVPDSLDKIYSGAASYLALMAAQCWRPLVKEIDLEVGTRGVSITAKGGELIPEGDPVVVHIEELLRDRIKELPYPFPVAAGFEAPIRFESNILSLLGIGLMTGLAPGLAGPWESLSAEDLHPLVDAATKELSRQSAQHYARVFPNEQWGQLPELYLNGLIFPPTLMDEAVPLIGALPKLLDYFKEYQIKPASILELGFNLAKSPDSRLSDFGLVLYGCTL